MHPFTSLALAALAVGGSTAPAMAFSLAPKNTSFTATGSTPIFTARGSIWCGMKVSGRTTATGAAKITSATLFGSGFGCGKTTVTHLPYHVRATGAGTAMIANVGFSGRYVGVCGPGSIGVNVDQTGHWTFATNALPGGCRLGGALLTTPAITVVP